MMSLAARVLGTDDDAVGLREVLDGPAFGEELRVHPDAEVSAGDLARRGLEHRDHDVARGPRHHRALDDHDGERGGRVEQLPDQAPGLADLAEVDPALARRRADREHDHVGAADRLGEVGGGGQAVPRGPGQERIETGLMERGPAVVDVGDATGVQVDADDLDPSFGQAGTGDEADIPGPDDRQTGHLCSPPWLSRYHSRVRRRPSSMPIDGS